MITVGRLARDVAHRLGVDAETVELTLRTAELHDVEKIAVPHSVLNEPGRSPTPNGPSCTSTR
jgi:response regulator RpfG family c-di-GMP phosphodiesterase